MGNTKVWLSTHNPVCQIVVANFIGHQIDFAVDICRKALQGEHGEKQLTGLFADH